MNIGKELKITKYSIMSTKALETMNNFSLGMFFKDFMFIDTTMTIAMEKMRPSSIQLMKKTTISENIE